MTFTAIYATFSTAHNLQTQIEVAEANFCFSKGPVSGFVGRIPLPTLESRINWNH